ncbi:uncharacterized protein [Symphalangus syndactylus]|uniref:uncharacterized protein n=1 Tax=Symphalangus syndactylus TaxID=9590 RepID=UPI0030049354
MTDAAPPRGGRAPPPPLGRSSSAAATRSAAGVVCARVFVRTRVAGPRGLCPGGEVPEPVVAVFGFPRNGWAVGCGHAASRPSRRSLHADAVSGGLRAAEAMVRFGLTRGPVWRLCERARFLAAWALPECAALTTRQLSHFHDKPWETGHPRACGARVSPWPRPLSESRPVCLPPPACLLPRRLVGAPPPGMKPPNAAPALHGSSVVTRVALYCHCRLRLFSGPQGGRGDSKVGPLGPTLPWSWACSGHVCRETGRCRGFLAS